MRGARSAAHGHSRARLTHSANADTRATACLLQQLVRGGPMKRTMIRLCVAAVVLIGQPLASQTTAPALLEIRTL
jgi:hypothetical protein